MSGLAIIQKMFSRSALTGAALAVAVGLLLWGTPLGEPWENASYDYAYLFGSRAVTNQIVFIQMEDVGDETKRDLQQEREQHAALLQKLTRDGARLVVFDVFFQTSTVVQVDEKMAAAMRQNGHVVLMGIPTEDNRNSELAGGSIVQPYALFLNAAAGCGLGYVDAQTLQIVRRHWPFWKPGEGDFHSLGWVAAETYGVRVNPKIENQWLRFYGRNGPGERILYSRALAAADDFFRGKVVFIGGWPARPNDPGSGEPNNDKFSTPYTHWTGQAIGGIIIHATTFLNLVNGDWLRRQPAQIELLLLVVTGFLIGGGLRLLKPLRALLVAIGIFFVVMCAFVSWSYYTHYWFPWLVIAGGQLPFALAWAWTTRPRHVMFSYERFPGYTPVGDPVGEGAYGKVWLVRNTTGELQALKEIELTKFQDTEPYEREFRGIKSYKLISNQHLGLLHVDYVYRPDHAGYFFYVMELGDALNPSWEKSGGKFEPRDLGRACGQMEGRRMPPRECIRIGIKLLEALNFLHQAGLIHRDIKPANIIFVNGHPKLADVGLIREAPAYGQQATRVYTPGFDDPLGLGTKLADMYALAITLYISSTGNKEGSFPQLPTQVCDNPEFMRLNEIILRACQPVATDRYPSAAEMLAAFQALQAELNAGQTRPI